MYMRSGGTKRLGCKLVELTIFSPEFMVRNKLSSKPQRAAEKLKGMVEGKNSICKDYDLSMRQDYGKGTVRLNLLHQCFEGGPRGGYAAGTDRGQPICLSREIPVTAAVKRYTDALKQMVEETKKPKTVQSEAPTQKENIGNILNNQDRVASGWAKLLNGVFKLLAGK